MQCGRLASASAEFCSTPGELLQAVYIPPSTTWLPVVINLYALAVSTALCCPLTQRA